MGNIPLIQENSSQIRTPQGLGAVESRRFPYLAEALFDQLDNQTLAECRRVSRPWRTDLDQQKVLKIRKILVDLEKFRKAEEEWNSFYRVTNTEMIDSLGHAIKTSLAGTNI